MDSKFLDKLNHLPEEAPDELDQAMIAQAATETDDTALTLDEAKAWLDFSGKLMIRIPKSLHYHLTTQAKDEGVSLNQYILYKLSH